MASENTPAWKRLGLKVKKAQAEDPLSLPTHLHDSSVTKNLAKSIKKSLAKRSLDSEVKKNKKPPKRVKLPKNERAPPPEKDQLVYLKEYTDNKDNWKFSKQKQNWLIKNVLSISDTYLDYILKYFHSIEGGSKIRVERELKEVIDKWNEYANSIDLDDLDSGKKKSLESIDTEEQEKNGKNEFEKTKQEEKPALYTVEQAIRAQKVYEVVTGSKVLLNTIDEISEGTIESSTHGIKKVLNKVEQSSKDKEDEMMNDARNGTGERSLKSTSNDDECNKDAINGKIKSEEEVFEKKKNAEEDKKKKKKKKKEEKKKRKEGKEKEKEKEKTKEEKKKSKDKEKNNSEKKMKMKESQRNESRITQTDDENDEKGEPKITNNSNDLSNLIIEDVDINDYV